MCGFCGFIDQIDNKEQILKDMMIPLFIEDLIVMVNI